MSLEPNKENKCPPQITSKMKVTAPQKGPADSHSAEYKIKIQNIQNQINHVKDQIKETGNEISKKDQCIKTALEQQRSENRVIKSHIKHIESLEHKIFTYSQEAPKRMQSVLMRAQMKEKEITEKFAEMVKEYNDAKTEIEDCKNREKVLVTKLESSKQDLLRLNEEYASLQEDYNNRQKKMNEYQIGDEALLKEISKLESLVKRLELQTKSLNSELNQKVEECKALSALYEDIGG
ncbi:tropomyosin-like [Euwallacea fornicatus]|uniref:tropomyosin-like n=1 Tax=Euwallacea fornicatus TaxID=995702 RepID=UPI00338F5037